jgi:hypothetical protein
VLRNEGEILWTYFSRDKYGTWSVKPHAREAFYSFMASWSIYLRDPKAYGFADILATLPPPVIHEHRLPMTEEQRAAMDTLLSSEGKGLFDARLGVKERAKLSQIAKGFIYVKGEDTAFYPSYKPGKVAELVEHEAQQLRPTIVWTVFDAESELVEEAIRDRSPGLKVGTLHGSDKPEAREVTIAAFKRGELDVLITKAQLVGYGLNFQNVPGDGVLRLRRLVRADVPGDPPRLPLRPDRDRARACAGGARIGGTDARQLEAEADAVRDGRGGAGGELPSRARRVARAARAVPVWRSRRLRGVLVTDCNIHLADCVTGFSEHLEPESVDLTVTSIPFGSLFMYSGKNEDIGNNTDGTDFVQSMFGLHLRFCVEELFKAHKPGTNACIHIQQLVTYRIQHGYMGRRDFRGAVIDIFETGRVGSGRARSRSRRTRR